MAISKAASEGARLMQGGLLDAAIKTFETGLATDPRDLHCWVGVSRAHMAAGRNEQARTAFLKLLSLDPANTEAMSTIALIELQQGKEGSLETMKAVSEGGAPGFFEHFNLGSVLQARGDWDGAEAAYTRAVKVQPDNPFALTQLGLLALNRGDARGALPMLKKAAELTPNEWVPKQAWARALAGTGQLGQAVQVLIDAVAAFKDEVSLYLELFDLSMVAGSFQTAATAARELRRLKPDDAQCTYRHGLALFMLGKTDAAKPLFTEAMQKAPKAWEPRQAYAKCLVLEKKVDDAIPVLEEAVALAPTQTGPVNDLASLYLSKKDGAKAERILKTALADSPTDDATNLNLALSYVQQGKKQQAVSHVKVALQSPDVDVKEQAERLRKQVGA
ncbi:MAG: tetratricopeptide repeat protein [Myxococcales bacterium]|nr:tetratricopeptide repeat protein [Myxococcales bacterium]